MPGASSPRALQPSVRLTAIYAANASLDDWKPMPDVVKGTGASARGHCELETGARQVANVDDVAAPAAILQHEGGRPATIALRDAPASRSSDSPVAPGKLESAR